MFDIPEELKKLPHQPGVYIMKDENGAIIYVGKAVDLHNRVRNYFQPSTSASDPKVRSMAPKIDAFEYVVTDSEMEALILECNLIKLNNPRYNIRLKDDKAYPYIKVTVNERLPRVLFSRLRGKDKSKYYGPYVSADRVREIIALIHRIWPLRRCQRVFPRDYGRERPCLNYHIGQCKGPCNRFIDETEYRQYIHEAERFIQGKTEEVLARLSAEMTVCAEELQFERAAELRDVIAALQLLNEKQKAETVDGDDRDVIGLARNKDEALAQVFFVRGGKMTGREHFMIQGVEDTPDADIYAAFIKQFYGEAAFIPKELVLPCEPDERAAIMEWLAQLKGRQVTLTVPQKGEKRDLVQLANNNAALTMEQFGAHLRRETENARIALAELAEALGLEKDAETGMFPIRIEAYDISNIQGFESVGSMIVFENGKAKNSDYRKFKIKGVSGPDDYASMEEVITRRFTRYLKEREEGGDTGKFSKLPDLLMIDGGKGHVSAAEKSLAALGLSIPVCGMVKDDRHRTRGLCYRDKEILPPRHSEGFKLITRIQDEVHRFAVEYHRKLRADSQVRSALDSIPGIGPTRRKALLRYFKGIEPIRAADMETLANVPAMNKKAAEAVYGYFHPQGK
jgi:excinuclease ABC subunit C